jgi:hypothetical protein
MSEFGMKLFLVALTMVSVFAVSVGWIYVFPNSALTWTLAIFSSVVATIQVGAVSYVVAKI